MTRVLIDAHNPRSMRAVQLAAEAGQWAKVRTADGKKAYGIPSSGDPAVRYLVTCGTCTCPDFLKHAPEQCKHILAVRLHVALVRGGLGRISVIGVPAAAQELLHAGTSD